MMKGSGGHVPRKVLEDAPYTLAWNATPDTIFATV